jgi:hypothetical protein
MRALISLAILVNVGLAAWTSGSGCSSNPGEPFDASGVPVPKSCSGTTAVSIPLGDCPNCTEFAYALCGGGTYSECACSLPSGYTPVTIGDGGDG